MKTINNLQEMNEVIKKQFTEIYDHIQISEQELPSYSLKKLEEESVNLKHYINREENYIPEYYNCGLLSRCLKILIENEYKFSIKFFKNIGFNTKKAKELAEFKFWY